MKKKKLKRSNSALNIGYPKLSSTIKYALSPEQMYQIDMNQMDNGIEGYKAPRQYYDYYQVKWRKKRSAILSSHRHAWPPEDWKRDRFDDRIRIKPKRITYIDELYKWCNSYYDKKKAESLIEGSNIDINEFQRPIKIDSSRRKRFLENEKKKEMKRKSRPPYPVYKKFAIEEATERKKKFEEEQDKDPIDIIKEKYKNRPLTARCDRVSVLSEAIHVGEQVPFYNTYIPDDDKVDKKNIKLFYPNKECMLKRYSSWKIYKPIGPDDHKKIVEETLKYRIEEIMSNRNLKPKDLWIKIREGYHKVTHHGEILMRITPIYHYKETEQYNNAQENHPKVYIGPQQYWKTPKQSLRKKSQDNINSITDDKGNKIYYMDRKKTDKRVYTAGLRKSVY